MSKLKSYEEFEQELLLSLDPLKKPLDPLTYQLWRSLYDRMTGPQELLPMESAPRDGTHVYAVMEVFFDENEGGFYSIDGCPVGFQNWIPLPKVKLPDSNKEKSNG